MVDQAHGLKNLLKRKTPPEGTPTSNNKCRVICISSGKGGVGKTNLAVNLSLALVQQGLKVVLFDGDLGMANVDILLGMYSKYSLKDVLYGEKALQEIVVKGPNDLMIIPGGSGISQLANLSSSQQEHFIAELLTLEEEADLILIDTAAGIGTSMLRFISAAHEVIVITTPEPTSITDAYSIIKLVSNYKLHSQVYLVVNRVHSKKEAINVVNRLNKVAEKYLHLKMVFLGEIFEDNQVIEAVRMQEPFILKNPHSRLSESVKSMALTLAGSSPKEEEKKGLEGFLKKMVKLLT